MKIGVDFDNTIVNTKEIVREFMDKYGVEDFKNEEEKTLFYRKYIDDITRNLTLKDGAKEILDRLKLNNELYILTARSDYYSSNLKNLTMDFIKKNIPIDNVYFDCSDKADICKSLKIDFFIDDLVENCIAVNNVGIKTVAFDNEVSGLTTVHNWLEVEEAIKWKSEL